MSEYTPTRGELISALVAYRATQGQQTPAEVASSAPPKEIAKFLGEAERGLAEVERAAAEKALAAAADAVGDPRFKDDQNTATLGDIKRWLRECAASYRRNEGASR